MSPSQVYALRHYQGRHVVAGRRLLRVRMDTGEQPELKSADFVAQSAAILDALAAAIQNSDPAGGERSWNRRVRGRRVVMLGRRLRRGLHAGLADLPHLDAALRLQLHCHGRRGRHGVGPARRVGRRRRRAGLPDRGGAGTRHLDRRRRDRGRTLRRPTSTAPTPSPSPFPTAFMTSRLATVSITVTPVNDNPVVSLAPAGPVDEGAAPVQLTAHGQRRRRRFPDVRLDHRRRNNHPGRRNGDLRGCRRPDGSPDLGGRLRRPRRHGVRGGHGRGAQRGSFGGCGHRGAERVGRSRRPGGARDRPERGGHGSRSRGQVGTSATARPSRQALRSRTRTAGPGRTSPRSP